MGGVRFSAIVTDADKLFGYSRRALSQNCRDVRQRDIAATDFDWSNGGRRERARIGTYWAAVPDAYADVITTQNELWSLSEGRAGWVEYWSAAFVSYVCARPASPVRNSCAPPHTANT